MKKRLLSVVLAIVLLIGLMPSGALQANAATTLSLAELQAKFPDGKYWNHKVESREQSSNYLRYKGWDGFENSVTSTPCWNH